MVQMAGWRRRVACCEFRATATRGLLEGATITNNTTCIRVTLLALYEHVSHTSSELVTVVLAHGRPFRTMLIHAPEVCMEARL